eukprot:CAMPEP_0198737180 /NCGR_PEP_ID=MMETSP1475-20131203/67735_1 /TAXON_ID= ORGANISM="Unidentified sp., Strain CCMP1999" /NCGR_SAMPLE_ID=MMETSP1475 /ASSEMBLY_ACC=CAM_ASM_001111 /LENGTH=400 /DNA_ID=CAMNT_0044501037 /DNA_START=79 /DNA_END=1281 /DNA_ORIENTATION=-
MARVGGLAIVLLLLLKCVSTVSIWRSQQENGHNLASAQDLSGGETFAVLRQAECSTAEMRRFDACVRTALLDYCEGCFLLRSSSVCCSNLRAMTTCVSENSCISGDDSGEVLQFNARVDAVCARSSSPTSALNVTSEDCRSLLGSTLPVPSVLPGVTTTPTPTSGPTPTPTFGFTPTPTFGFTPTPTFGFTPTPTVTPFVKSRDKRKPLQPLLGDRNQFECFPGHVHVTMGDGSAKKMSELSVGDVVLAAGGKLSAVFAFTHRDREAKSRFVRIETRDKVLDVSAGHYIVSNGALKAARELVPGDLINVAGGEVDKVEQATYHDAVGLYNPHTLEGSIVVNGMEVSCYTEAIPPKLAHRLLFLPAVLYRLGMKDPLGHLLYGRVQEALSQFTSSIGIRLR